MKLLLQTIFAFLTVSPVFTIAQPVSLKADFGVYPGFTHTNIDAIAGRTIGQKVRSLLVLPGGKFIMAGESGTGGLLIRYNNDGTIDPTFGTAGKAVVYTGPVGKALLQPDGKIVVSIGLNGNLAKPALVRYNADGTPDAAFGTNGVASVQIGYQSSQITNIALQPDGKIVGVGTADYFTNLGYNLNDFGVCRFNANGTLDNTFDGDGKKLIRMSEGSDQAETVDIDLSDPLYPTGKIVVGGAASPPGARLFATARLLPNGNLDASFDTDGILVDAFTGNAQMNAIKVLSDGKILTGGGAYNNSTFTFNLVMIRYNVNGTRDNSFSGDGLVLYPSGDSKTQSPVKAFQLLAGGKIIVASGRVGFIGGTPFVLSRYNSDGSLDISFDTDGILTTVYNAPDFDEVIDLVVDGAGNYMAGGESQTNTSKYSFGINRYTPNGSLDNSFSGDGKYVINFPGSVERANSIVIQADGKLLVAGYTFRLGEGTGNAIYNSAIMRYTTNGLLDATWGNGGILNTNLNYSGEGSEVLVQPDGKVVVATSGTSLVAGGVTVLRYNSNGTPDVSFDGDGKATIVSVAGYSLGNPGGIGITTAGQLVVACNASYNGTGETALLRINTNGSLDNTYGSAGMARFNGGVPVDLIVLPDGRALVGANLNGQGRVVRFLASGNVDAAGFNGGSRTVNTNGQINDIALDAAGNILACGYAYTSGTTTEQLFAARITTTSAFDNSFGTNGIVTTNIVSGYSDILTTIQIQANGSILGAGIVRDSAEGYNPVVVRYTAAGVLDNTFNSNTGFFTKDLKIGSFDFLDQYVQNGNILYGAGNIRTDMGDDFLIMAVDVLSTVLPVNFISFTARQHNGKAQLNFTVSNEQNLSHYLIERSADGLKFDPIGTIYSLRNSSAELAYNYTDASPVIGNNYYRITSVDKDGSKKQTQVRQLTFGKAFSMQIFPNPAQNYLQVTLPAGYNAGKELSIINTNGQVMRQYIWPAGTNTKIDIRFLPSGKYWLTDGAGVKAGFIKQ